VLHSLSQAQGSPGVLRVAGGVSQLVGPAEASGGGRYVPGPSGLLEGPGAASGLRGGGRGGLIVPGAGGSVSLRHAAAASTEPSNTPTTLR
jgi:hypothetical protein